MDYSQTQDWLQNDMDFLNIDQEDNNVEVAESVYIPQSVIDSEATISIAGEDRRKEFGQEMRDLYDIDINVGIDKEEQEQDEDDDIEILPKEDSVILKKEDESSENEDYEQEEKDDEMITSKTVDIDLDESDTASISSSSQEGSDSGSAYHVDPETGLPILYPGSNLLSQANVQNSLSQGAVGENGNGTDDDDDLESRLSQGAVGANGNGNDDALESRLSQGAVGANGNGNDDELESRLSQGVPGGVVVSERPNLFLSASQLSDCPPGFTGRGRTRRRSALISTFGIVSLFFSFGTFCK